MSKVHRGNANRSGGGKAYTKTDSDYSSSESPTLSRTNSN